MSGPGTAARLANRRRDRHGRVLGATRSAATPPIDGGDGGPIGLTVEIFVNSAWTDISQWAQYRAGATKIPITRGRGDETSQVPPQTATVVLNNRDGRFSPRNPNGPYYGQLTRNTPIRISRLNNGIRRFRFYGEIPSWPRASDISGRDVTVTVNAAGMLRRLRQGNKSIGSALYRAYTVPAVVPLLATSPLPLAAYWPCQDGKNSTSIASGLASGTAMTVSGTPTFATDTAFACSDALPQLSGSIWTGIVPTYTGGVDNDIRFLLDIPSGGSVNNAVICRVHTAGTVARLDVQYLTASSGSIELIGYSSAGTTLFTSTAITGVNGNPMRLELLLQQSGADVFWAMFVFFLAQNAGAPAVSGTLSTASVGNVASLTFNPGGQITDTAIGHVAVQYDYNTVLDDTAPLLAWELDPPDVDNIDLTGTLSRFSRLCAEQNVPSVIVSSAAGYEQPTGPTIYMGQQLSNTFGNLLQEPVDQTLGLLHESRDQLALALRTRASLYNQTAKLTLDHSQHQLSAPLIPVDDDTYTRNDVTVQRINGSSYTVQQTTGTMSVLEPPDGAGDYETSYNISLFDDTGLPDHAGWRLHMGTVDEPRYPQVSLNLRHPTFTGSVDMMNAALTLDIGDRIVITNPPTPDFPPDDISLIVQGYTEVLGTFEHDMVITCTPESPYRIGILDDSILGRLDTDGSTLAGDYPLGTEATLLFATTGAASPLWTTDAGEFPFDVNIGGEQVTVTNITGSSSPQTATVTRSVNGVVKSQTSGTDVRLWQPLILSL